MTKSMPIFASPLVQGLERSIVSYAFGAIEFGSDTDFLLPWKLSRMGEGRQDGLEMGIVSWIFGIVEFSFDFAL